MSATRPSWSHLSCSQDGRHEELRSPGGTPIRIAGARNDLRERFVRQAPMVPLRQGSLTALRHWLRRAVRPGLARSSHEDLRSDRGSEPAPGTYRVADLGRGPVTLVVPGRADPLRDGGDRRAPGSSGSRAGPSCSPSSIWPCPIVTSSSPRSSSWWTRTIPILVACLAKWLFKEAASDVDQIKCWDQKLAAVDPVPHELVLMRVALVRRLCDELNTLRREAARAGEKNRGLRLPLTGSIGYTLAVPARASRSATGAGPRSAGMAEQGRSPPVVGIDLGGTKILAAVVAADNTILGRAKAPTPAQGGGGGDPPGDRRVRRRSAGRRPARPGRHRRGGHRLARPARSRRRRDPLQRQPQRPRLPARARPVAAPWAGRCWSRTTCGSAATPSSASARGRATRDVIAAFVGTGIGGCIIPGGRSSPARPATRARSATSSSRPAGPECGCGARGCLEAMASRTAITRRVNKAIRKGTPTILREKMARKGGRLKSGDLAEAVAAGDQVAVKAVDRAAHYLGLGLGSLINVLGPEIVVIGGGVAEALGEPWIAQVREVARGQTLVDRDGKIRIEPAALGDDAGIHGAACSPANASFRAGARSSG